jgi:hypothetical protein
MLAVDAAVGFLLGVTLHSAGVTFETWQFWVVMVGATLWRNSPRAVE